MTAPCCSSPEPKALVVTRWPSAGAGKPFFTFGTEPPACQLQCWSLEPYLKQWLLQEEATRNMPAKGATGAFLGSLVSSSQPVTPLPGADQPCMPPLCASFGSGLQLGGCSVISKEAV